MGGAPRLLVVEGNTRAACAEMTRYGGVNGADLYVRVIEHIVPGAITDILCAADPDCVLPAGAALADYDGVVVGGSGLRAFNDVPEVRRQVDFARAVFEAKVPFFGSCWAVQVAAVAAGGVVAASPRGREIGFARKIELTPEGRAHPMFRGRAGPFDSFAIHFDEIAALPPGAVVLAANPHSRVQALSITAYGGTFWGLQYHPEFDLPQLARLYERFKTPMVEQGFHKDEAAVAKHAALLDTLHQDPARRDLAWLLGIDDDILDQDTRYTEIRNWLESQVLGRRG